MPGAYQALTSIEQRNLKITGLDFYQLENLSIRHVPNEHAVCLVEGYMEKSKADKLLQQAEMDGVKIEAVVKSGITEKKQVIFFGKITELRSRMVDDRTLLSAQLMDTSILMDLKKESRTYQNLKKKYDDVIQLACKKIEGAKVQLSIKDKAIEKWILQLDETAWEFTLRMASRFQALVFSDLTAEKPLLYVGLRTSGQNVSVKGWAVGTQVYSMDFEQMKEGKLAEGVKVIKDDFTRKVISSYTYVYLGDEITVNDKKYYVWSVQADLIDGMLQMRYGLAVEKTSFLSSIRNHPNCAGQMLRAQVKKVEKDVLQLHFLDIDEKYDEEGDTKIPFATVYSSRDGSGWYVMPEPDDYVRVMFPTSHEEEAFAASSVNMMPMGKPKDKSFRAPGGREILLTDKGVEIICEHQKIFANLSMDNGITVVSSKDVKVSADGNISLKAKGKVQLVAEKEINLKAGSAHVRIESDKISMGAGKIIVGE